MALSNIFREPRREIIESAIGLSIIAGLIIADYEVSLSVASEGKDHIADLVVGMIIFPIGLALLLLIGWVILRVTHFIGEEICDSLEDAGVRLRPRDRR